MKNKTPLMLIELAVMILVLATASIICVNAFVWSHKAQNQQAETDNAYIYAQSAAELLKHFKGDYFKVASELGITLSGNFLVVNYDENWQICDTAGKYILTATPVLTDTPLLSAEKVAVVTKDGEILAELEVSYQKEEQNE